MQRSEGTNLSGIDPVTKALTRLFHPRLDVWADHFEWDGPELVGRTRVGRTTVGVLSINALLRVAARHSLLAEGRTFDPPR